MAVAVQHAEKFLPWANGFAILVREDSRDLVKMGHVVDGPGGEELRKGDGPEGWVGAATLEVFRGEVEGFELA